MNIISIYRVTLEVNKDPLGSEFETIKVSSNTKFGAKIKAKKEALKNQDVWVINRIVYINAITKNMRERKTYDPFRIYDECSQCGFEQSFSDKYNFCPNCGARMNEVSE